MHPTQDAKRALLSPRVPLAPCCPADHSSRTLSANPRRPRHLRTRALTAPADRARSGGCVCARGSSGAQQVCARRRLRRAWMHNLLYRGNALFTVSTTVLGAMCILTALTDLAHRPSVRLDAAVRSVDGLQARAAPAPAASQPARSSRLTRSDPGRSGSTATTGPGCPSSWTWTCATCLPGTPSRRGAWPARRSRFDRALLAL